MSLRATILPSLGGCQRDRRCRPRASTARQGAAWRRAGSRGRDSARPARPSSRRQKQVPNPSGAPIRTVPESARSAPADLARDRQRLGLHGLGLGEEPLAMLGQGVALRAALEELGLERAPRGREMRRETVAWSAPSRRAADGQAARAGDREEEAQVVPVERLMRCPIGARRVRAIVWRFAHGRASTSPYSACDFDNDRADESVSHREQVQGGARHARDRAFHRRQGSRRAPRAASPTSSSP